MVDWSSSSNFGLFQLVSQQGLIDLEFMGNSFTWTNGRDGSQNIMERLDRGVANGPWRLLFPQALVKHLQQYASDHASIVLNTERGSETISFRCILGS